MPPAHTPQRPQAVKFPNNASYGLWQRVVEGSINGSFSYGSSSLEEVWELNFYNEGTAVSNKGQMEALAIFVSGVLGYSYSRGPGRGIKRVPPVQHPEIPYLYASKVIGPEGIGPVGQFKTNTATWKLLRVRVVWETPIFNPLPDDQVTAEWQRYTTIDIGAQTRFLNRPSGGNWTWDGSVPNGLKNKAVPIDIGSSLEVTKTTFTITWYQVPDDGLFEDGSENNTTSPNIEECVGAVNSLPFMGRDPGTMLLESWKPTPILMPFVSPTNGGAGINSAYPRAWNVQLVWSYFNPLYDTNVYSPKTGPVGHQLLPHPTNGLWYRPKQAVSAGATNQNNQSYQYIYPMADHNQCFLMNT